MGGSKHGWKNPPPPPARLEWLLLADPERVKKASKAMRERGYPKKRKRNGK